MTNVNDLRNRILEEAHGARYTIHPGCTKMNHDLREVFWWDGLNRDIAEFFGKCPNWRPSESRAQKVEWSIRRN